MLVVAPPRTAVSLQVAVNQEGMRVSSNLDISLILPQWYATWNRTTYEPIRSVTIALLELRSHQRF